MCFLRLATGSEKKQNLYNKKKVSQPHKRPSSLNIKRCNAESLLYMAMLAIVFAAGTYSMPFDTLDLASKLWHRADYVPQYPLATPKYTSRAYNGENSEDEDNIGIVQDEPTKRSKLSIDPNIFEELAEISKEVSGVEETEHTDTGYQTSKKTLGSTKPKTPISRNVHRAFRRSPADMGSQELENYLSAFYLIKTPYGYVLGRQSPGMSSTSIARRSVRSSYPKRPSPYELPNFQLRVRKDGHSKAFVKPTD